uniref:Uncharacterized protein n=1 Tax=Chlamydomonas euryale TaxID=1486919 RepID=A0A7R9V3X1_9CHLO|mmetsp:Transcript_17003/g.50977  ORF Transcript_17003/g.50977 Transcript_17003/m.50977 type:complete len:108 (+) Transcript_17003:304-627(+)
MNLLVASPSWALLGVMSHCAVPSEVLAHKIAHSHAAARLRRKRHANPHYENALAYATWKYEKAVRAAPWFQHVALWNDFCVALSHLMQAMWTVSLLVRAFDAVRRMG